jgi:DNA-binding response OmpR family regulator
LGCIVSGYEGYRRLLGEHMPAKTITIAIADDDPLVREACKAVLEQRGHTVLLAEDGAAAIVLVESRPIDLLLLDILMPNKEGLETLIEIKRRFPGVRVFAMSGGISHAPTDFLSVASKFGADAILRKPFGPQKLFDLIDSADSNTQSKAG